MATDPLQVLIVEDDAQQADLLADFLGERNYRVQIAATGTAARETDFQPDFILLDLNLPDIEGIRLCPILREQHPDAFLVMLTARKEEIDRVIGLELGADDYITKPYSLREVDARMRAIYRRHLRGPIAAPPTQGLSLERQRCMVRLNDASVELTAQEFRVLEPMVQAPKRIYTRSQLIDIAWEEGLYITDRVVDAMVARIRKKLRAAFGREFIFTKHGMGYGFDPDN